MRVKYTVHVDSPKRSLQIDPEDMEDMTEEEQNDYINECIGEDVDASGGISWDFKVYPDD